MKCKTHYEGIDKKVETCYSDKTPDDLINVLQGAIQNSMELSIKMKDRPYRMKGFIFSQDEQPVIAPSIYDNGIVLKTENIEDIQYYKKQLYPKKK